MRYNENDIHKMSSPIMRNTFNDGIVVQILVAIG
jgi:hypothetical protein